jgi:arylsulfatase A-like enzyme
MRRSIITSSGSGFVLALVLGLAGCGASPQENALPSGPHPVIVVAVDGLRADTLGCYGNADARTPSFDALARESVRFQWAFAQAGDAGVSFAALLDGLYPTTGGVRTPGDRLPAEATTLAEAASAANLKAVAFVEGPVGGDAYGLDQGFEEYRLSPEPGFEAAQWLKQHGSEDFLLVLRGWTVRSPVSGGAAADEPAPPAGFNERLQKVLAPRDGEEEPSLEPGDVAYVRQRYADRIAAVDGRLGELMSQLEDEGLRERATIVVVGTNGLDLLQHGLEGRESLHSTVTRVPLLVRFPGGATTATVNRIVELVDVMPTVLEAEDAPIPAQVQGRSLLPLIRGEGTPPYRAFSETPAGKGQTAMALGGFRLLATGDGPPALYDLASDPLETTDVAAANQERVDVLQRQLEAWRQMVTAASLDPSLRSEKPLDDATLERLKSLGYVH